MPEGTKRILVVDDDPDIRRLLDLYLRSAGYETVFAADGISAVGIGRKERPDLVLLDIGLPAGDAFMVMERFAALPLLAHVPVIVVSAQDAASTRSRALAAGASAFFSKPIERDKLVATVRAFLDAPLGAMPAATGAVPARPLPEPVDERLPPLRIFAAL